MKKFLSLALSLVLLALSFTATAFAESSDPENFTRIVSAGMDPYGVITINEPIDPDTAKWAVIYYRLNTPLDSKGVGYIGQFYVCPEAEPHIVINYDITNYGEWQKTVVDMTNTWDGSPSRWSSSTEGADFYSIRFDPLEINRNDPFYGGEVLEATHVNNGDNIDIAYIAFFNDEAKANEFDGTQDTYVTMIDADAIYDMTNQSGTLITFSKEELEEEDNSVAEESSEESTDDASIEESTDNASIDESKVEESKGDASTNESKTEESKAEANSETTSSEQEGENDSNIGIIIGIVAAVVVIGVIVVIVITKKKKK